MTKNKVLTAAEEYPELEAIASDIARMTATQINIQVRESKTVCPYPAQCTLELLIQKLEGKV